MNTNEFILYSSSEHTPEDLLNAVARDIGGISITPGSVNYIGVDGAVSFFHAVDFGQQVALSRPGILLSSGTANPPLSNTSSSFSTYHNSPGDSDFDRLAQDAFSGAGTTYDAAILEFSFTVTDPAIKSIRFELLFGSEEYPQFVDSSYVDIAAILVNGVNYALFDGDPKKPLSVVGNNTASGSFIDNYGNFNYHYYDDPYYDDPYNEEYYNEEYYYDDPYHEEDEWALESPLSIEYNGMSPRLVINIPLDGSGFYEVRIGVADTGDSAYDSGLFISNFTTGTSSEGGLQVTVEAGDEGGETQAAAPDTSTYFEGGTGNDIFVGGTAVDTYDLTKGGANIVKGTSLQLNGDQVYGFGDDDTIMLLDAYFTDEQLEVVLGSAILKIDSDGNGAVDTTITLVGDYSNAVFATEQVADGTEITLSYSFAEVTPSQLYLGDDTGKVVVTGTFDILPLPGLVYGSTQIVLDSTAVSANVHSAIAQKAAFTLPSGAQYQYQVNLDTGAIDVLSSNGKKLVALPISEVSGSLVSPLIRIGDGEYTRIELDPQSYEIVASSLPGAVGGYDLHQADSGVGQQTLVGTDGVVDFFVFEYRSDDNGGFADFGQVTVQGYNQDDGDMVVLVDLMDNWRDISDIVNLVQPNYGNALITFNNNPEVTLNSQSLQIMGALTDGFFGQTVSNINNVEFAIATQDEIGLLGGITAYVDGLLAGIEGVVSA